MPANLRHKDVVNYSRVPETIDAVTYERTFAPTAIFYEEEYMGAGKQTFPTSATTGIDWVKHITGSATVASQSGSNWGQVQAALASINEVEEGTLDWGNALAILPTKGLVFETYVSLTVVPAVAGVQAIWGFQSNHAASGPDTATNYCEFGVNGSGVLTMRAQDGVNQVAIATSVTMTAGTFYICRIDMNNLNDIGYYVNGVQMNTPGQITYQATGLLQPFFGVYKSASAGLGTLQWDYCRLYSNRM